MANINRFANPPRILIAPLDWGLGHATRCIPVIKALLEARAEVLIAADGPIFSLLQQEFPAIEFLPLMGYNIGWQGNTELKRLLFEYKRIKNIIKYENQWLQKVIQERNISAVISDCRFGLYNNKVPCVIITHQLNIETGNRILNWFARKINFTYLNKFNTCWIPDNPHNGFAGKLAHPRKFPVVPIKYIGILSRFIKKEVSRKFDYLFLISGPEPQRSILEQKLLSLNIANKKIALVRGLPNQDLQDFRDFQDNKSIVIFNHLTANELNNLIAESDVVICRSGYSSVMDLITLQKKGVFIPTPGQTEQIYLAHHLKKRNLFLYVDQKDVSNSIFDLRPLQPVYETKSQLKDIIAEWLISITKN